MTSPVIIRLEPSRLQDFILSVDVGDPMSEFGLTHAQLTGTGRLTISHYRQGGEQHAQSAVHGESKPILSELDRNEVVELFDAASGFDWQTVFPTRPGIPDEAIVEWTLRDDQNGELRQKAWLRDVEKDEVMSKALGILRRKVEFLSDGRLFL